MRPLIGIPPSLDAEGRWRRGRVYHYLDAAYTRAVEDAGGTAVYLPGQRDPGALVARIDGLLVPGGDDFAPPRPYPADVCFERVPESQQAFDTELLAAALERGIPVLGICYGMQLLALHHGGRLHYDIPTDVPGASSHRLPEPDGRHRLRIEPGSALGRALAGTEASVNSLHHQGVADAGALRVAARAEDDLIEAIEDPDHPFCLGVQWHPEKMPRPHRHPLFSAFLTACRD